MYGDSVLKLLRALAGLCLLVLQFSSKSYADDISAIDLRADQQEYWIGLQSFVLRDEAGTLDLSGALKAWDNKEFIKEKTDAPNYGFTGHAYWYRFAAKNSLATSQSWYFVLESPLIDEVVLNLETGQSWTPFESGDRVDFSHRDLKSRFFVIKVDFAPGETKDFFLRLKTEGSSDFRMAFRTLDRIYAEDHDQQMFQGAFVGILCVMMAYFGLLALGSRKLDLITLSLYIFTLMMFKLTSNGVAFEYLWPHAPSWANYATVFSVPFVFFGSCVNAYYFLPVREHKRLQWIYRFYIALFALFCGMAFVAPYRMVKLYTLVGITSSAYVLASSTLCYLQGFKPARYFILAWSTLLLGSIVYGLQKLGLIPISFLTLNGVEIATFFFVVLLALGTSEKYNELNKALAQAQAEALAAQIEANRLSEEMNTQLELQVRQRTAQLWQKTKGMSVMLENLEQGICTIDRNLLIQGEYSPYLERILGEGELAGKNIEQVLITRCGLDSEMRSMIHTALLVAFDDDAVGFEMNAHLLPRKLETQRFGQKLILDLDWAAIEDQANTIQQILLSIRDVTAIQKHEEAIAAKQQELEAIGRILELSATKFRRFIRSATSLIEDSRQILDGPQPQASFHVILRNIHTIKGNARTYGLEDISSLVHSIENDLFAINHKPFDKKSIEQTERRLLEIEKAIAFYRIVHDEKLKRGAQAEQEALMAQLSSMLHDIWNDLSNQVRIRFQTIFQRLDKMHTNTFRKSLEPITLSLPGLAKQLSKSTPEFQVQGVDFYIDPDQLSLYEDIFVHLVRNSLDHGFIQGDEGMIILELQHTELQTKLIYRDNGRGLNIPVLKRRAMERGLLEEDATMQEVAHAIFHPGVSSARVVTEISGRGVGMDAVKACVQKLKGEIDIKLTTEGPISGHRRFEFHIALPLQNTIIGAAQYTAA